MNRWALIEFERVTQIEETNPKGKYHPSFVWIDCEEDVKVGYGYTEECGFFVPEPPPEMPRIISSTEEILNIILGVS